MSKIIYVLSMIITASPFVITSMYLYGYATTSQVVLALLLFLCWTCCLMITYVYKSLRKDHD